MSPRKYSKLRLALGNSDKAMMQTHKNESSMKERQLIHDEDIHDEHIHDEGLSIQAPVVCLIQKYENNIPYNIKSWLRKDQVRLKHNYIIEKMQVPTSKIGLVIFISMAAVFIEQSSKRS